MPRSSGNKASLICKEFRFCFCFCFFYSNLSGKHWRHWWKMLIFILHNWELTQARKAAGISWVLWGKQETYSFLGQKIKVEVYNRIPKEYSYNTKRIPGRKSWRESFFEELGHLKTPMNIEELKTKTKQHKTKTCMTMARWMFRKYLKTPWTFTFGWFLSWVASMKWRLRQSYEQFG